jgi:alpha-1,2-mannosyltransferase
VLAPTEAGSSQSAPRQHVLGRLLCSQWRAARLFRRAVAVLAMVLGLAHLRFPIETLRPEYLSRKDFLQEYTLARAIADGIDPYLPTEVLAARYVGGVPNVALPHPTPHPPPVGLLLLPLSLFDYPTAAAVWFGLEIVLWVASVYLLGRALGVRPTIWATLGIAMALLIWYPLWVELTWGQLQVPMLALLAGAWVALRSGRSALAGALVGLAILIKPIPLPLLLLFVLRKDWRGLLGAGSVVCAGYLAAACVVGPGTLVTYFTTVLPLVTRIYRASWGNLSISSLGWRIFYGTGSEMITGTVAPPLVRCTAAAEVASVALPCLVLLVACLAVRRQRSVDVSLGVLVSVSILTMPISWPHYLVLAAIPAAQAIHWLARHHLPARETNLALIVGMLLIVDWVRLARFLVGLAQGTDRTDTIPFALAQIPLMAAVAVGALAWLVGRLGPADASLPTVPVN